MAIDYFQNGGIADEAQEGAISANDKHIVSVNGALEGRGNTTSSVALTTFGSGWSSSDATVTYVTPTLILLNGTFTAGTSPESTIASLPAGYNPVASNYLCSATNTTIKYTNIAVTAKSGSTAPFISTADTFVSGDTVKVSLLLVRNSAQ